MNIQTIDTLQKKNEQLTLELERVWKELAKHKYNTPFLPDYVRKHPSRLEIAVMIRAAWESNPYIAKHRMEKGEDLWMSGDALEEADKLIAHSRIPNE
jgi:hypothetical protein